MQMAKWKDWPPQKRPEVFPCFYNFIDADGNRILAGLKPLEDEFPKVPLFEFRTNHGSRMRLTGGKPRAMLECILLWHS